MYNIFGQQVLEASLNTIEGTINTASLASGSYFANIMLANGEQDTIKIIKN